ncbi:hypothetical protein [Microbulbifer epialgicus]|uniref:Uncharacterized protein n=1 Tax=Microbulbifer epialgicus TaxID=393907 RepID=A0ABV4NTW3_9GAMM
MKDVATEVYRAVVALEQGTASQGSYAKKPESSETLEVTFTKRSRHLLRVLSETFAQSESEFASTILNHGLSDTLKILPDVLSDKEFAQVEEQIVSDIGLSAYLSLQPVLTYQKGINLTNFAEVSTGDDVYFGRWLEKDGVVSICDFYSHDSLFIFEIKDRPIMSIDGVTWQWSGLNVKPLYGESISHELFVSALEKADILILNSGEYFYKKDEYSSELIFSSFSNSVSESCVMSSEFKKLFRVTETQGNISIEPTSNVFSAAEKGEDGFWICGQCSLLPISVNNVIISPED